MVCSIRIVAVLIWAALVSNSPAAGVRHITATADQIIFKVETLRAPSKIVELQPNESPGDATNAPTVITRTKKGTATISIPRFDGARDRIYSGFVALENNLPVGLVRFVEEWNNVSKHNDLYPKSKSKKGLQVQMDDDALALGVKHAALNLNFGQMVALQPAADDLAWQMDGRTFHFRQGYVQSLDAKIKPLSEAGVTVTLILLSYEGGDAGLNKILLHPQFDKTCPEHLGAFNTTTPEGLAWFKACVEFLAERYSMPGFPHGHVANYILGNEVNSHWYWSNMGRVTMQQFADDYARTLRICNTAVRKFSSSARVFISLEHHWNIHYAGCDETQGFAARPFIDYLSRITKSSGDFDWHLAFHPYPENLADCRTWNDKTATLSNDTPRITFKNLEMLVRYFRKPELRYHGEPRRIILSEQGFHSPDNVEGELLQAAAYCYAYRKAASLDGIDAFILHRHVDYRDEGGLNLGLWRRNSDSPRPSEPLAKKKIYEAFRLADTPAWRDAFEFALPVIGIKSWRDIEAHAR